MADMKKSKNRILIADDDPSPATCSRPSCSNGTIEVIVATNGVEALGILESRDARPWQSWIG